MGAGPCRREPGGGSVLQPVVRTGGGGSCWPARVRRRSSWRRSGGRPGCIDGPRRPLAPRSGWQSGPRGGTRPTSALQRSSARRGCRKRCSTRRRRWTRGCFRHSVFCRPFLVPKLVRRLWRQKPPATQQQLHSWCCGGLPPRGRAMSTCCVRRWWLAPGAGLSKRPLSRARAFKHDAAHSPCIRRWGRFGAQCGGSFGNERLHYTCFVRRVGRHTAPAKHEHEQRLS